MQPDCGQNSELDLGGYNLLDILLSLNFVNFAAPDYGQYSRFD